MARRYAFGLTDFTPVQTIYRLHFHTPLLNVDPVYRPYLRTARLEVDRNVVGSRFCPLATLAKPFCLKPILDVIYERLDGGQEHIVLLILDAAHQMRGFKVLASGAQAHVWLDRKLLFRSALLLGAKSIIVVHNHPTGSTTPSPHDLKMTRLIARGGRLMDITVIDHVIYTTDAILSLREQKPELFQVEDDDEEG
ncbi:MAG TPA: JAB domain-containing protein [Polyangia bacterium]|jgi:DNA repair protein RadC|nr:JAB domain-containing protein [Polyangia bacterium]